MKASQVDVDAPVELTRRERWAALLSSVSERALLFKSAIALHSFSARSLPEFCASIYTRGSRSLASLKLLVRKGRESSFFGKPDCHWPPSPLMRYAFSLRAFSHCLTERSSRSSARTRSTGNSPSRGRRSSPKRTWSAWPSSASNGRRRARRGAVALDAPVPGARCSGSKRRAGC